MKKFAVLLTLVVAIFVLVPTLVAQDDNKDVYGRTLPEDAAPYQMQVWQELCNSTRPETSLSSVVTVYSRICDQDGNDKLSDSLVDLDENLQLIPAAAESWDVSSDGLTWNFHLRPGQVWSDGTPLTANDWVASFRYMVDPNNAYDFVWLWNGVIDGWDQAQAGEIPPDQVGVSAPDDNTFSVKTQGPLGFLPITMVYWPPMQAAALEKYGPNYILDPATSVSSGPFVLKEFVAGQRLILEANPTYNGYRKPYLREIRGIYGDQSNGSFLAFQTHQVDRVNYGLLSSADFAVINADPDLSSHYLPQFGDFRSDYLLFDTYNPPFDKVGVRLAFAKAIDRDSIVQNVIGSQYALSATSFLAPGFPASDSTGALKDIQAYDCPAAQQLLADAGYPDGQNFPAVELDVRNDSAAVAARFLAAGTSIADCLNVPITVNNVESGTFMAALNARPTSIQFGGISYGMDYLDPNNMLTLWQSNGRHSWRNADFDNLVDQARAETDAAKRLQEYQDAERILVSDVGGAFIDWRVQGDLWQPYVAGECFRPDAQGISAWHWYNNWCWGSFYITQNVANFDTYRTHTS